MGTVTREIVIDAPAPIVWRHISDPAERRRWIGGDLDVALSPGERGAFRAPAGSRAVRMDEVEPGRSVTFTWGEDDAASRVRIEVEADGDGSRVRVTETTDADAVLPVADDADGAGESGADDGPVASVTPLRALAPWARAA